MEEVREEGRGEGGRGRGIRWRNALIDGLPFLAL